MNSGPKSFQSGSRYMSLLVEKVQNLPYHRFIGLRIMEYGEGRCRIQVSVNENILNPCRAVHGGIVYSLCDVCAYIAVTSLLSFDKLAVTADINISLLSAVTSGTLDFEASVLKMGKRTCFIESRVMRESDMVAIARITKSIIDYPKLKEVLALCMDSMSE